MFKSAIAISIITGLSIVASPSLANDCKGEIIVSFSEGAPVDKFRVVNRVDGFQIEKLEIDLSSSKGRLIFDTISGGKGVDVFQPYKTVSGSAKLVKANKVEDGTNSVSIGFEQFGKGQDYTFSIDVDDQLTASDLGQIRVTGGEMENAHANFVLVDAKGRKTKARAIFDDRNKAVWRGENCQS